MAARTAPDATRRSTTAAAWLAAAILLSCGAIWTAPAHGAIAELYGAPSLQGPRLIHRLVASIDPRLIVSDADAPREKFSARWTAAWPVDRDAEYALEVAADDRVRVSIDGRAIITPPDGDEIQHSSATIRVSHGLHPIVFEYEQRDGGMFLDAAISENGGPARPLPVASMVAVRDVAHAPTRRLSLTFGLLAVLALIAALRLIVVQRRLPSPTVLTGVMLAMILLVGGALRLDALLGRVGSIDRPAWLHAVDAHARLPLGRFAPPRFQWVRGVRMYQQGDPAAYLFFAREMKSFYAAHPREPLFIGLTRTLLPLAGQENLAVGLASSLSSFLSIAGVFALGYLVASPWAGLLAALAFAVDRNVIAWSVEGWRDDTFALFFLLSACLAICASRRIDLPASIASGLVMAAALLTRITSLAFIVPAGVALAVQRFRASRDDSDKRVRWPVLAGTTVAVVLAGPYFINCYRTFGTPLYPIDVHTSFYRSRAGVPYKDRLSALAYIRDRFRQDPIRLTGTFVTGMTTYPFLNKWNGFEDWMPNLGRAAAALSLIGLILLLENGAGRLLLLMTAGSLVPYAFTHDIQGGAEWRFTMHVYPVLLIAAALAVDRCVIALWRARDTSPDAAAPRRALLRAGVVGSAIAALVIAAGYARPYVELAGDIWFVRPYTIFAEGRHALLFANNWSQPEEAGNVISRDSIGATGTLWLPMARKREHQLRLRLDPRVDSPEPRELRVYVNRRLLSTDRMEVTEGRIGSYDVVIPNEVVQVGLNRVDLLVTHAAGVDQPERPDRIRFWYARLTPKP